MRSLFFLLLFSLRAVALQLTVVDKESPSREEVIHDLLALQKSLIVSPVAIPEPILQRGFLLVPMAPEYVASLLEKKGGQIVCAHEEGALIGYIILTEGSEFAELYRDPETGRFDRASELTDLDTWLADPSVGYIEQIGVDPDYLRKGIGSQLIEASQAIKPHGLISDVFIYPVKNTPSLLFFSHQHFLPTGILYQFPGANANFPHEHRTQVFVWRGD